MKFTDYYFAEAKLSLLRQFKNLFAKEKQINIDIETDIKDKGYFSETSSSTFATITDELSRSYRDFVNLRKRKKELKYTSQDKILARQMQKKALDIGAGKLVTDVFNANITGGDELISPYQNIQAAAAYETGKHLIHYGYIVMIITEVENKRLKYYVGGDRLGLSFFKELFGTNMDTYLSVQDKSMYSRPDEKEEKPETKKEPEKSQIAYISVRGSQEEKVKMWEDIQNVLKTNQHKLSKIGLDGKTKPMTIDGKKCAGYDYILKPSELTMGIYQKQEGILVIIFYEGDETIEEVKNLHLFDDLKTIKSYQLFNNVKYAKDIPYIKI